MITREEFRRENKNTGDRVRRSREKQLREQALLLAQLLCESHSRETLGKLFNVVLGLMKAYKLDSDKRASLAEIFTKSAWQKHLPPYVGRDGNLLNLEGTFDMRELAKYMVWTDVEERMRVVNDDNEAMED